jgi:hypothetical protein
MAFDLAANDLLYVADCCGGSERCFVDRDLVTVFQCAQKFDAGE